MNIVAGELSPRKKRRLLALDDDRSWLDAMKALLEQAEDLDVDVADNAQLATDRASSNNYDIVTADVRIDRFNRGGAQGDEWMLKQLPLLRSARKAIVTAYPGEIKNRAALKREGIDIIQKSTSEEEAFYEGLIQLGKGTLVPKEGMVLLTPVERVIEPPSLRDLIQGARARLLGALGDLNWVADAGFSEVLEHALEAGSTATTKELETALRSNDRASMLRAVELLSALVRTQLDRGIVSVPEVQEEPPFVGRYERKEGAIAIVALREGDGPSSIHEYDAAQLEHYGVKEGQAFSVTSVRRGGQLSVIVSPLSTRTMTDEQWGLFRDDTARLLDGIRDDDDV